MSQRLDGDRARYWREEDVARINRVMVGETLDQFISRMHADKAVTLVARIHAESGGKG